MASWSTCSPRQMFRKATLGSSFYLYMNKTAIIGIGLGVVLVVAFLFFGGNQPNLGEAPSGLQATIATTSAPTVGTTAARIFATSTCSARVITTYAQPIMLTFSDASGDVPSGTLGHLQSASTTVTYDSGIFGCNTVKAYSFGTQTIWVSESR